MSRSNFIKPIIQYTTQETYIWYWLCMTLSSALVCSITIITATQWYIYYGGSYNLADLQAQLMEITKIINEQRTRVEEQQQLQKHLDTINRYKTNPKNPRPILQCLRTITQGMTLQTATIDTNHFEISVRCNSLPQASHCLKQCHQEPAFAHIMLTSLHVQENNVYATITGRIVTHLRTLPS